MLHDPLLIPPSADFWPLVARAILGSGLLPPHANACDLSAVRVLVPGFVHAQQLKSALSAELRRPFIAPRIITLAAWIDMLPPDPATPPVAPASERMMSLYAELRQHGWLKKLFTARRNTDLLPLAQTLLTLFDELTRALVPSMQLSAEAPDERWQAALAQLPVPARNMVSDEAQLVWTLWKSQLDANDPVAFCHRQMMRLAAHATEPLIWISPVIPDTYHQAFLEAYAQRLPVLPITLDWRAAAVAPVYAAAWGEMLEGGLAEQAHHAAEAPAGVSLCAAGSLEEEAQRGAQIILGWLQSGKNRIAIIAQDRVVARRIRALLERAQVFVSDETGWKLSTTRAAAAVAALLDVVTTRAETVVLLDLLKSPFLFAHLPDKGERVMAIEHALRRFNVLGGWEAADAVLRDEQAAREILREVARQAALFAGRKTLGEWAELTSGVMEALGMREALQHDAAGVQVVALLDTLTQDAESMHQPFSFSEWRAFLGLQMELAPFVPSDFDRRVVMLQLNGAQLRCFDAVLMVGADADHLPSRLDEMLFFANAVRRELGLPTREMRQRQQLRDFAELLSVSPEVVLSWQAYKNGEPNPVSSWVERLQLSLERAGRATVPMRAVHLEPHALRCAPPTMPAPAAPQLVPRRLSASGYNSLVACPYQFFATRMLGLDGLGELSDMPEKRDYGDWLHEILLQYHEAVRDRKSVPAARESLLREISEQVFGQALDRSAAALGYYARWQKVIPAYLAWANERESQGWQFVVGEQQFQKTLSWEGGQITLHGCVDRIDENADGERAILDYKTRNMQSLRDKAKESDDHQLAFYGVLSDVPVAAAHYVALEVSKDKTGDAAAPNYGEWQSLLEAQIVSNIRAIGQGAPLPAAGIERICVYCEVRGLCRKGAW
ncbi:PD-(D/E)XK nuclease family protein [Noviherbaspirillum autotrophicum]|uniref:Helicase I n=1 Tax=Noviherbaspirillum autotrophicum TaxID=709839 RepID=A0A0C1YIW8_9BURK|nr:PD-(D/E)XK nuclease family protein [Noviherbaspirillum autotrophicum]KIF80407.1 helicase I [Noviherbaspirillum autotrophicum]